MINEQTKEEQIKAHWSIRTCKIVFYVTLVIVAIDLVASLLNNLVLVVYAGAISEAVASMLMALLRSSLWVFGTYKLKKAAQADPTERKGTIAAILLTVQVAIVLYTLLKILNLN